MQKVVIVVPLYKIEHSPLENISLIQLYRVLGKYPICYISPRHLREQLKDTALWVEYFDDEFFRNVAGYSRLCLDSSFYERFEEYEYMLLYQTDAFAFTDQLLEFCAAGYDYIGAPWPRIWTRENGIPSHFCVGNGGFSLRKIQSCLRLLKHKEQILMRYGNREHMLECEDVFWAYASSLEDEDFSTPPPVYACRFSLETWGRGSMRNLSAANLPFGCHGWTKYQCYPSWKKWIEAAGYLYLPEVDYIKSSHTVHYARIKRCRNYLWKDLKKRWSAVSWRRLHYQKWRQMLRRFFLVLKCTVLLRGAKLHVVKFPPCW